MRDESADSGSVPAPADDSTAPSTKPTARAWRPWLLAGERSSDAVARDWTLILSLALVAVCAWPPWTFAPIAGLEGGWQTGLQLAYVDGLDWGREVTFTYGPLGFVAVPQVWNLASLVGGLLYTAAAVAAVTAVPFWILRQHGSRVVAFGFAVAFALAAPTGYHVTEVLSLGALLVAIGAFQGTLPLRLMPLAGLLGGVTAIQALVKPPTAAIAMLACALVVLAPQPGTLQRAGVAGAALLGTFLVAWLAVARQSVADLPAWVRSVNDLTRHYSEAMFIASIDRSHEYIAAALLVVGLVAYVARFSVRLQRRDAVLLGSVLSLALWIFAKQAFVRQDGHSTLFFFVVPALAAAIWTVRPVSTRPLALLVASGLLLTNVANGPTLATELDPGPSLRSFLRQVTYIALPNHRQAAEDAAHAQLRAAYAPWVPEPVLSYVSGSSVHVDPWETSLVWAYGLNWKPVPAFQRYVAYTAKADEANAEALESDARAPDRILRQQWPALDGRNDLWDSPRYMLNLACLYRQSEVAPPWQVLERARSRCGLMRLGPARGFAANELIPVPPSSSRELVVVWLDLAESLFDRITTFLFRPSSPILVTAGGVDYRIATTEVAGPLLVRIPDAVGWAGEFGGGTAYASLKVNREGTARFAIVPLT
jgi:hypothetical protein